MAPKKKRSATNAADADADATMADRKNQKSGDSAAAANANAGDGPRKRRSKASADAKNDAEETLEDLEFDDPFEDELDDTDETLKNEFEKIKLDATRVSADPKAAEEDSDDDDAVEAGVKRAEALKREGQTSLPKAEEETEEENHRQPQPRVWRPSDGLGEDEKLEYDAKFYSCYHALKADWPCLSFDIIRDKKGELRTKFPATMYMVTGTQAERGHDNKILIMKISDIHRTKHEDDDEEDDDDDDGEDDEKDLEDDPILATQTIDVDGEVNRIRSMPQQSNFVASWQSTGKVQIWNIDAHLAALEKDGLAAGKKIAAKPIFSHTHTYEEKKAGKTAKGRPTEGFALDWSSVHTGRLASGDCHSGLSVWEFRESSWEVDSTNFKGHTGSVEDIQWSPNEPNVLASCSADSTIRIWDIRQKKQIAFVVGHKKDINVISWNRKTPAFLVSGSDDATLKVWDFRKFASNSAIAQFKYHTAPITSVEWHPHEDSMFAASSADNTVTVWDLALERDADFKAEGARINDAEYPAQLYFVHAGQKDVKEVHFHPQIPALMLSTAADGFNIFKPANMELTAQQLQALSQPYKPANANSANGGGAVASTTTAGPSTTASGASYAAAPAPANK